MSRSITHGGNHFFFTSRRRHTRFSRDWSSDVCSSDLQSAGGDAAGVRSELGQALSSRLLPARLLGPGRSAAGGLQAARGGAGRRSEERRVGNECSAGGSAKASEIGEDRQAAGLEKCRG